MLAVLVLGGTWQVSFASPGGLVSEALVQSGSKVQIEHNAGGFQLIRNGAFFFIKGAGGDGSKTLLKDMGGNSFRTWGVDNAGPLLDEAQKLGLTVTLGIWLGHREHGFDYNNAEQVAKQIEEVRAAVTRYRSHPALLMWALGNEMEGDGNGAAIWSAINNLASMVKQLDPNHPTMTVIAELGASKVKNINRLCPNIDVVGINSYGGGPSVAERYKAAGGTKPYVITEFGPAGVWEIGTNSFNAVEELSSSAKQQSYTATYTKSISNQPLCLGSYAFAWGNKQEATATWFGLMLPDGSRLGAIDTLSQLWTGKSVEHPCPEIKSLKVDRSEADPGATVHAVLDIASHDISAPKVTWVLQADVRNVNTNGATETAPPTFPDSITVADAKGATIKLPSSGGIYRLFAYARDSRGGAAVANIPLHASGPRAETAKAAPGKGAKLPYVVYDEGGAAGRSYIPSGYMGNTGAIHVDEKCEDKPHSGKTCMRVDYSARDNWGGVVWQDPANDWGDLPGGMNLTGATKLTFWSRGAKGGEKITFICGLLKSDKPYHDTALTQLPDVLLTNEWKQYTIDLKGKDLTRIKTGFAWTLGGAGEPITFYLDDIRFE